MPRRTIALLAALTIAATTLIAFSGMTANAASMIPDPPGTVLASPRI